MVEIGKSYCYQFSLDSHKIGMAISTCNKKPRLSNELRTGPNPEVSLISTSHIERQNLTMRMQLRRFTRLTNAFSKKLSHLKAACALHFAHYNFCRIHQTLRVTPSLAAGITDHIWSIEEIISLLCKSGTIAA
jgi:hypothetical protein